MNYAVGIYGWHAPRITSRFVYFPESVRNIQSYGNFSQAWWVASLQGRIRRECETGPGNLLGNNRLCRNDRFVFTWVAELIFGESFKVLSCYAVVFNIKLYFIFTDSAVFIATLSRTLVIYRRHRHGAAIPLIKIMMRDGTFILPFIFYSFA